MKEIRDYNPILDKWNMEIYIEQEDQREWERGMVQVW